MNAKYSALVGTEIELRSKGRTYRFRCTKAERVNEVNLVVRGIGPQLDKIFSDYCTTLVSGQECGASVNAVKDNRSDQYHITVEIVVTDQCFWKSK